MTLAQETATSEDEIQALVSNYTNYDFFYVHIKTTDSQGEDGNFPESQGH